MIEEVVSPVGESRPCACGCGQLARPGRVFVHGHNKARAPQVRVVGRVCACGCGRVVTPRHRFAHGHNNKPGFRRLIPAPERFWRKVRKSDGCWEWIGNKNQGYGRFNISPDRKRALAHRYSYELHNGPIPVGLIVCHHCDNPLCVRPDHLYAGTDAQNVADRESRGRASHPVGEAHGLSKMTPDMVRELRRQFADGVAKRELARRFGISTPTITQIVTRRTWKHVA